MSAFQGTSVGPLLFSRADASGYARPYSRRVHDQTNGHARWSQVLDPNTIHTFATRGAVQLRSLSLQRLTSAKAHIIPIDPQNPTSCAVLAVDPMVLLAKLPLSQKPAKVGSSHLFYGGSGNDITVLISLGEAFPTKEGNAHRELVRKAIDNDVESAKALGEGVSETVMLHPLLQNALSLRLGINIYSSCEVIVTNVFHRDIGTSGGSSTVQTSWNRDGIAAYVAPGVSALWTCYLTGAALSGEDAMSDVLLLGGTFSTVPIPCPLSATQCDRFRCPAPTASTFPVSQIQYLVLGGISTSISLAVHKCRYGLANAVAILNSGFILTPTIT
ncbi:hypothetical protein EV401DRAFT_2200737, partial [Pisolithus croceorrhizus]